MSMNTDRKQFLQFAIVLFKTASCLQSNDNMILNMQTDNLLYSLIVMTLFLLSEEIPKPLIAINSYKNSYKN